MTAGMPCGLHRRHRNIAATLVLLGLAYGLGAQAWAQAADGLLTYDVVSVKPNKTGSGDSYWGSDNDEYHGTNVTVKSLIQDAYSLPTGDLISGIPGWVSTAKFDIQAKVDVETIAMLKSLPKKERAHREDLMMQSLLADRFQLKVHHETRELQVYQLVIAKSGSKLKEAKTTEGGSLNWNNQSLTATIAAMESFCHFLSDRLHRKVEDRTGLSGRYDFTMQWSPDEAAGESAAATGADQLPSLFTAVQEQLGLKLEPTKGLVDTIVVDHVQMPSDN